MNKKALPGDIDCPATLRSLTEREHVRIGFMKALITANPDAVGHRGWTKRIVSLADEMMKEIYG